MSGGLPVCCPVCLGKSKRENGRAIEQSDDGTGSLMQYRLCIEPTTPKCPHKTESFKTVIGWSSSSPYSRVASTPPADD